MRINNNIPALSAFNALNSVNNAFQKVIKQVSTGLRINSAADDAAGLAISENLRAQTLGLDRAVKNAQDGISLLQTAEGALGETNSMLQRMRELAVQAANDTLTSQDRNFLQMEIDELKANIDRIANTTQFNTKRLLDGSCCGTISSTDAGTKGRIHGAIDIEGNYRIEIKANPGAAQVQKAGIFRIKHENVVTNVQTNDGIDKIEAENLPAGDYAISTAMGSGGDLYYKYESTLGGEVTEANTSGANEIMTLKFHGAKSNLTNNEITIDLEPEDDTPEKVAEKIRDAVNGKTIKFGDKEVTLSAVSNGGKYTITASGYDEINSLETDIEVAKSTKIGSQLNTRDAETWTAVNIPHTSQGISNVSITYDGKTQSIGNWPAGTQRGKMAQDIQDALKSPPFNQQNTFITYTGNSLNSASSCIVWTEKSNKIPPTFQGFLTTGWTPPEGDYISAYKINYSGKITAGNTSNANETLKLTILNDTGTSETVTVTIPKNTQAENIPALIEKQLQTDFGNPPKLKRQDKEIEFKFEDLGGGNFKITSDSPNVWRQQITFSGKIESTITAKGKTTTQQTERKEIPFTEADGKAVLTGSYGFNADDAFSVNLEGQAGKVQNNASILFTVTGAAYDSNSKLGTVTLSAVSNVMGLDGSQKTYTNNKIVISTSSKSINLGSLLGEVDDHFTLSLKDNFDISQLKTGHKFVYNICGVGDIDGQSADTSMFISGKQDSSWPYSWDKESGGYVTLNNEKIQYNFNAAAISNKELRVKDFYLDSESGKVYEGNIKLSIGSDFQEKAKNFTADPEPAAAFTMNYVGKIATSSVKLRDLEQFWTKSGTFMLQESQTITISQNDGRKASITLNVSDTIEDLRRKLNDAISEDLGQGLYTSTPNSIVTFVDNPSGTNGIESVKGTLLIRSLVPGSAGDLTFSSSYGELIDALALNTVQKSEETSYTVSVYDAHNGAVIAQNVKTANNILQGVIHKNIDIEFDAMAGVNAEWSEAAKNFIITPGQEKYITTVHIARNNISFQTGAREGEEISLDIGDMSSAGLGINGLNVTTHERASRSITILDEAIKKISNQRSKIGAYQNSLEHTMESLTVTSENLTSSESRIRDADMSKSMLDFVKFQLLNRSSTSMLAQANQMPQSVLSLMQ